jgi:acyl-CoA thioester hydrolase
MSANGKHKSYDVVTHEHVRYSDLDSNGHVNNVAVADYVATGRVAFLEHVTNIGAEVEPMALRHLTIEYLAELHRSSDLVLGARLERIGTRSFTVAVDVLDGERVAARSESVAVVLGEGRATELTPATRDVLEALLQNRST